MIGRRLFLARKAAKYTQQQVADEVKVTRQAVSAWERGAHSITACELGALAVFYGVSADYLIFGGDPLPARAVIMAAGRPRPSEYAELFPDNWMG